MLPDVWPCGRKSLLYPYQYAVNPDLTLLIELTHLICIKQPPPQFKMISRAGTRCLPLSINTHMQVSWCVCVCWGRGGVKSRKLNQEGGLLLFSTTTTDGKCEHQARPPPPPHCGGRTCCYKVLISRERVEHHGGTFHLTDFLLIAYWWRLRTDYLWRPRSSGSNEISSQLLAGLVSYISHHHPPTLCVVPGPEREQKEAVCVLISSADE